MWVLFASLLDTCMARKSQALLSTSIYPQYRSTSIYGHQMSLLNKSTCVCVCVCVCVHVCVRVKSQSQCGFYLQAYWIWLGKARHCYLHQSTHSVHRSTSMYGHQMSLLNKSTCVCVCVCVCVCLCVCVCVHMRVCMCVCAC